MQQCNSSTRNCSNYGDGRLDDVECLIHKFRRLWQFQRCESRKHKSRLRQRWNDVPRLRWAAYCNLKCIHQWLQLGPSGRKRLQV